MSHSRADDPDTSGEMISVLSEQFEALRDLLIQEMARQQESFLATLKKDLAIANEGKGETRTDPRANPTQSLVPVQPRPIVPQGDMDETEEGETPMHEGDPSHSEADEMESRPSLRIENQDTELARRQRDSVGSMGPINSAMRRSVNSAKVPMRRSVDSGESTFSAQSVEADRPEFRLKPSFRISFPTGPKLSIHATQSGSFDQGSYDNLYAELEEEDYSGCLRSIIGLPRSKVRMAWAAMGLVLIVHDLISLPLLAFNLPDTVESQAINWFVLIYWTLNMAQSCTMGYVEAGAIITDPKKICRRYLRTWFIVDSIVLVPDWLFTLTSVSQGGSRGDSPTRLISALRLVRLVRIVRIVKFRKAARSISDALDSEKVIIAFDLLQMLLILLMVNHFVACVWFSIGEMQAGASWTKDAFALRNVSWRYRYWTAYHWSITQFTPASMNVNPLNEAERIFAVCIIVVGVVGFSYVVGSISGSLTQLRALAVEEVSQFRQLNTYLKKNKVPRVLALRIVSHCQSSLQRDQMTSSHITLLTLLTEQLKQELQLSLLKPLFDHQPLLHELHTYSTVTCARICMEAASTYVLARCEHVFITSEVGTHMMIVSVGRLEYETGPESNNIYQRIADSDDYWISEPVLWVDNWLHVGNLKTLSNTELLMVHGDKFFQEIKRNPLSLQLSREYAVRYVEWMRTFDFPMTDIHGDDVYSTLMEFIPFIPAIHKDQGGSSNKGTRESLRMSLHKALKSMGSKIFF